MAITPPNVGESTKQSLAAAIIAALNSSTVSLVNDENNSVPNLINGSFETYDQVLGVNVPINWEYTLFSGGAFEIDTNIFTHGIASVKFTSPGGGGNGGGYIQSKDFLPISPNMVYGLQFFIKSDVGFINSKLELLWFNSSQNPCAVPSAAVYNKNGFNAWNFYQAIAGPPSDACFCKVKVTGGSIGAAAGNTWIDGVQFFKPDLNYVLTQSRPIATTLLRFQNLYVDGYTGGSTSQNDVYLPIAEGDALQVTVIMPSAVATSAQTVIHPSGSDTIDTLSGNVTLTSMGDGSVQRAVLIGIGGKWYPII